jgi:glycosyltransferase involved in cell wall biosynthesis
MTERMRVLMTADAVGGVWTYACELVRALAAHDVEVTIATMGTLPSPAQVRAIRAIANAELVTSELALEWMPDPWSDVDAAGDWLLGLAQRVRPHVVHLNGYVHAVMPFEAPVVVAAHSDVCTWFRAVRGAPAPAEWDEYRRRVAAGLVGADAVVAPTRAILQAILDEHRVEVTARVIPNGRDPSAWRAGSKEPFVLAAGRLWDEANGLDALDACAPRVAWPIHVAGPTAGPCGIGSVEPTGVRMLGELRPEALADWMGHASIYALPARYEPFGLSIVEAALAGAALVLGEIDTLEEVWGDAATFVPPGDPDVLAFALNTLAADPLRRRALAASARTRALALTPQRMAAAYHELYEELVGAKRAEVCA